MAEGQGAVRHLGHALVELLREHGVDTIYGLPGGQTQALYSAVADTAGALRHMVVRDERTAAYAADAHARLTGGVGVCDATVGPGAAKLPSGLGEAFNSSVPVLALVSELATSTEARRYRGATSQALDQEALLAPVTKWVGTVRRAQDLAPVVRRAFREATTGRPGPVAVILPVDVLDGPPPDAPVHDPHAPRFGRFPALRVHPDPADVAAVADLVVAAERPLLVAGGGARLAGAHEAVAALVGWLPVATTLSGKGVLDETQPAALGVLGSLGTSAAAAAAERADLLVLAGTKLGSATSLGWTLPRAAQEVAVIDVDPVELGRDLAVDALLHADARLGLEALGRELAAHPPERRPAWWSAVAGFRAAWQAQKDREGGIDTTPVAPQRLVRELQPLLTGRDVVVADASLSSGWVGAYLEVGGHGPRTLLPRGLAGLGWAVPAAIGAAVAAPDARIVAVMGDGAAAYAVGELATLRQEHLDVKLIVLNNQSLGWIRWYRRVTDAPGWEQPDLPATDFAAVAAAYGLPARRVEAPGELAGALRDLLDRPGPGLVEVVTETWQTPLADHREAVAAGRSAGYGI